MLDAANASSCFRYTYAVAVVDSVWAEQLKLMECLTRYGRAMEQLIVILMHSQRAMVRYYFDYEIDSVSSMDSMVRCVGTCTSPELAMYDLAMENQSLQQCVRMDAPCAVVCRAHLVEKLVPDQCCERVVVMRLEIAQITINFVSAFLPHTIGPNDVLVHVLLFPKIHVVPFHAALFHAALFRVAVAPYFWLIIPNDEKKQI